MALLDFEKKEGLQYGTVGDECYHCRRNRNPEEVYEPASLDRQLVYKLKIYGNEYCLCEDCFKKTLGSFILIDPNMQIEEDKKESKPVKKQATKKEEVKEEPKTEKGEK